MKYSPVYILFLCGLVNAETVNLQPAFTATVNNSSKVSQGVLKSVGTPKKEYTRGVLKFDFSKLAALKYAKVKKASLKFKLGKNFNPGKVQTEVRLISTPWKQQNLSWAGTPWPRMKKYSQGYIDLCTIPIDRARGVVNGDTITFDVTDGLNRLLYEGCENNGFLLRTGPRYLGGKHDKGRWEIDFTEPEFSIEFSGKAPDCSDASVRANTIRFFPSAMLPPVSNPYYFAWCNWSGKGTLYWDEFKNMNVEGTYQRKNLLQRGVLSLKGVTGPQGAWFTTPEAVLKVYENRIGIAIDEWQKKKKHPNVVHVQEAIRKLHKTNPEEFVCIYSLGESTLGEISAATDLNVLEGYTHTVANPKWGFPAMKHVKVRLKQMKERGISSPIIVMLGELCPRKYYDKFYKEKPLTVKILEEQVKYLRENYPEFPGVGFFARLHKDTPQNRQELRVLALGADKLCYEYFVKPAPELVITKPAFNAVITTPHKRIKVNASGQNKRKISLYRYFIDNRLIGESAEPEFLLDCRGLENGNHTVTVHAVDSGYNRTARQIPVRLQKAWLQ